MGSTIATAAIGALAMMAHTPSSPAQASIAPPERNGLVRQYQIPAGSLGAALNEVADQSDLHVLYPAGATRGLRSPGLKGAYSIPAALDRLLAGTGLEYRFANDGRSVSIVLAQANTGTQTDARGARALPTIDVGAARRAATTGRPGGVSRGAPAVAQRPATGPASTPVLPRALQLGGRLTGYSVPGPVASTKTNIPIMQTPFTVQSVTREIMDDRQTIRLKDAVLTSTSGVNLGTSGLPTYDGFSVRGFDTGDIFYRNGLRQALSVDTENANLQSIEILKGPAAMLYGRVEPGGIVNLVPKRPLAVPYFSIQQQGGSFGTYRGTVDATGPLNEDKSILYRINAAYNRTDTFRDFGNRENFLIAPVVTWKPTDRFTLNVEGEIQRAYFVDDLGDLGIPAFGRRPALIPISRYPGEPVLSNKYRNASERDFFGYDWTYQFVDDWSITNRFSYQNSDFRFRLPIPYFTDETNGDLYRATFFVPGTLSPGSQSYRRTTATNIDLKGKVVTGPFTHQLLAGFDYFYNVQKFDGAFNFEFLPAPINIFNPIYLGVDPGFLMFNNFGSVTRNRWRGLYAQDHISFWDDKIHILLGGRHDNAEVMNRDNSFEPTLENFQGTKIINRANSPMAGVLIQPFPWLSIYGNYTRSFGPSQGFNRNEPLPPQRGLQYEGGVKAELLDKRLFATFAYFNIFKTNIARAIPGTFFVRAVGEAESRGVEFDLTGRFDDNWSIILNYAHMDTRFTKDEPTDATTTIGNDVYSNNLTGKRLASIPQNQGNLWVKYEADGDFRGLSVGGGVSYVDWRYGDDINTYVLPAYARVDGMVSYNFKPTWLWQKAPNLTFQANIRNLFGATYHPVQRRPRRAALVPRLTPRGVLTPGVYGATGDAGVSPIGCGPCRQAQSEVDDYRV